MAKNHHHNNPPLGTIFLDNPVDEDASLSELLLENGDNNYLEDNNEQYHNGHGNNGIYGNGYQHQHANGGHSNGHNSSSSIYNTTHPSNISWEYKHITLTRVPGYGFGIAVSGGSDNPHFANGDPAIAISDVLKGGPAEGKLLINDRIITANTIKLENVDYGTAVQVLRDSGPTVNLIIKRRIINQNPKKVQLHKLTQAKFKNLQPADFGVQFVVKVFVKESKNGNLIEGEEVVSLNGVEVGRLWGFRGCFQDTESGGKVLSVVTNSNNKKKDTSSQLPPGTVYHQIQRSYDSTGGISAGGNLYVHPPTRDGNISRGLRGSRGRLLDEINGNIVEEEQPVIPPHPVDIIDSSDTPPPPPPPPPNNNSIHGNELIAGPPRFINFIKKANTPLGLKLIGGNNTGIFIGATHPQTPASTSGLAQGDLILRVNDTDFTSITRACAVQYLSQLPPESLVSFIVKNVENFRVILDNEKFHDLKTFRLTNQIDMVTKGSIVTIYDTLSTFNNGYEGVLDYTNDKSLLGERVFLPKSDFLMEVKKVPVSWKRPLIVFGQTGGLVGGFIEFVCNSRGQFFEEFRGDVNNVGDVGGCHRNVVVRGGCNFNSVLEKVVDLFPLVIVIKCGDKQLLKKVGGGSGGNTLLRSFNKKKALPLMMLGNHQKKMNAEEINKLEKELGAYLWKSFDVKDTGDSNNGWAEGVARGVEQELFRNKGNSFWWVAAENNRGDGDVKEQQPQQPTTNSSPSKSSKTRNINIPEIPNYNIPPPHSTTTSNLLQQLQLQQQQNYEDYYTTTKSNHQQSYKPIKNNHSNKSFKNYTTQQPTTTTATSSTTRLLAHSPVEQQQQIIAPIIDRTKKPPPIMRYTSPYQPLPQQQQQQQLRNHGVKPTPPPKPSTIKPSKIRPPNNPDDIYDNYNPQQQTYLNLPGNSKIFKNNNSSAFVPIVTKNNSIPVLQERTTSGTFGFKGGVLRQRNPGKGEIPVEVWIPEGAIPQGTTETIWFHCVNNGDSNNGPGGVVLNNGGDNNNRNLISPLVKFGPEGLRFLKPIEIRIPQYSNRVEGTEVLMRGMGERGWSRVGIGREWVGDNGGDRNGDMNGNGGDSGGSGDGGDEGGVRMVSLRVQRF